MLKNLIRDFNGDGGQAGGPIQFVYDVKHSSVLQADLVGATVNESKNAVDCSWITKGSLILRDLGYFAIEGLRQIEKKKLTTEM